MLRTVHLHGRLGARFGKRHVLDVESPAEALKALLYQFRGFENHIKQRSYIVTAGRSRRRDRCTVLCEDALKLRLGGATDIHIVPAPLMAGVELIILGITLVLVAISAVVIFTMVKAPKPGDREAETKAASHVFDGPQNVIEQGHPVPLVYGEVRTGSVVVSSGISTADLAAASLPPPADPTPPDSTGEDPPPAGGGTTVGSTDGTYTAPGGALREPRTMVELQGGGKADSGGASSFSEAPNSLISNATARVLEVVSEGEIVGLLDGLKSVYLDDTPVQNNDGTFNFAGATVQQRVGLPDQDYVPGFSSAENTIDVNTEVKVSTGPVVRTIDDPDVTVARVTIRVSALYQQSTDNGDISATSVSVAIAVQADGGGYSTVYTMDISGKTNQPYDRSVDVHLPAGATRNIKVTRLTADSASQALVNPTRFQLLTEVIEAKLAYPDTALVGLIVDARQFGTSIPVRSYHVRGLIIEVPSNYNPATRAYTGVWNGTFKRAWTDNPAWILRDLLVNRRYGLGARIGATIPDKWALYSIAQYCDENVPNMLGGQEPRYTLNTVIASKQQAYDVIAAVASNFRGWVYWSSGTIVAAMDRPEDPSVLVTRSNTVDGQISYGRVTPHERRRSAAVVYWNDPEDGYKLSPEVYENPDLIRKFGRRTGQEITAFGVTRRGHAHRLARFILEDESEGSNTVADYAVGEDHSFVSPSRIAMIADPMFTQNRRGGRVRGSTVSAVTIDDAYTFVAGQVYTLRTLLPDGTVSVRPITNAAGTATVVTLGGANWTALTKPKPGAVWTIETNVVANRQFRVRQIETNQAPYRVKAVLHDPTKYARVELDRDLDTPNYIALPSGPLQSPDALNVFEYLEGQGTASVPVALFSWSAPTDARIVSFQAQAKGPSGHWIDLGDGLDPTRTVRPVTPGAWSFRVRAVDGFGRTTVWKQGDAVLDGQTDALPEVTGLAVANDNVTHETKLTWGLPAGTRPLRYRVLFHAGGVLANAALLAEIDAKQYPVAVPGTYWVRSTFLGFTSPAPPSVVVSSATGRITDVRGFEANRSYGLRGLSTPPTISETDTGTTITLNIGASSLANDLGDTLNLPSGSVPGNAYATKYYLFRTMTDPRSATGTYGASTSLTTALAPGKVYLGFWTTSASGGGGGGGGGTYGSPDCVVPDAWVLTAEGPKMAELVRAGDQVQVVDQQTGQRGGFAEVTSNFPGVNDRVRLTTESGLELALSINTPMLLRDGSLAIAAHCRSFNVAVEDQDGFRWERVVSVESAGFGPVAAIKCGGQVYAAGDRPDRYVYSHNLFEQKQ